jgi:hypothetical protein
MEFIETPIFTKRIKQLISDEDYHLLQLELAIRPESGDLIKYVAVYGKNDVLLRAGEKVVAFV